MGERRMNQDPRQSPRKCSSGSRPDEEEGIEE
ncbi:hypothetical protein PVAP13_4KG385503 [Panicum virgatum]|uniref:Uncharacterized protein n=1 Tax=Panicum virgatum TaxID=38727 RepID=A0A8T0U0I8_PANVG|nr:hypothetical protein PVAP13_4KG385503 [Panicum virgatum]